MTGQVVGPVAAVSAPSGRITEDRFDEPGARVCDAAAWIGRALQGER